ncbi:hypothetical protein HDV00_006988, partial [Rhizophlyctis rosea]
MYTIVFAIIAFFSSAALAQIPVTLYRPTIVKVPAGSPLTEGQVMYGESSESVIITRLSGSSNNLADLDKPIYTITGCDTSFTASQTITVTCTDSSWSSTSSKVLQIDANFAAVGGGSPVADPIQMDILFTNLKEFVDASKTASGFAGVTVQDYPASLWSWEDWWKKMNTLSLGVELPFSVQQSYFRTLAHGDFQCNFTGIEVQATIDVNVNAQANLNAAFGVSVTGNLISLKTEHACTYFRASGSAQTTLSADFVLNINYNHNYQSILPAPIPPTPLVIPGVGEVGPILDIEAIVTFVANAPSIYIAYGFNPDGQETPASDTLQPNVSVVAYNVMQPIPTLIPTQKPISANGQMTGGIRPKLGLGIELVTTQTIDLFIDVDAQLGMEATASADLSTHTGPCVGLTAALDVHGGAEAKLGPLGTYYKTWRLTGIDKLKFWELCLDQQDPTITSTGSLISPSKFLPPIATSTNSSMTTFSDPPLFSIQLGCPGGTYQGCDGIQLTFDQIDPNSIPANDGSAVPSNPDDILGIGVIDAQTPNPSLPNNLPFFQLNQQVNNGPFINYLNAFIRRTRNTVQLSCANNFAAGRMPDITGTWATPTSNRVFVCQRTSCSPSVNTGHFVMYDTSRRLPDLVAWVEKPGTSGARPQESFTAVAGFDAQYQTDVDAIAGTDYNKGHIVGSNCFRSLAYREATFTRVNLAWQHRIPNQKGSWRDAEIILKDYANDHGVDLFVVAGTAVQPGQKDVFPQGLGYRIHTAGFVMDRLGGVDLFGGACPGNL